MNSQKITLLTTDFNSITHHAPLEDVEYWYARELMPVLGYDRWENFKTVVAKAVSSCTQAGFDPDDHFRGVTKMVEIGSGAQRPTEDVALDRYACYLIAQNGDPRKDAIAFAQTYFALQTRKQELIEERLQLQARLEARKRLTESETELSKNIYERGVDDRGFGRIRSKGDAALFGGKNTQQMKNQLEMPKSRPLADFLPTVTIAAKNLAAEITNHNVSENDLQGETAISSEHVQNNRSVRSMLGERGIQPENLPPAEDLKKLERRVNSAEKKMIKGSELPKSLTHETKEDDEN